MTEEEKVMIRDDMHRKFEECAADITEDLSYEDSREDGRETEGSDRAEGMFDEWYSQHPELHPDLRKLTHYPDSGIDQMLDDGWYDISEEEDRKAAPEISAAINAGDDAGADRLRFESWKRARLRYQKWRNKNVPGYELVSTHKDRYHE